MIPLNLENIAIVCGSDMWYAYQNGILLAKASTEEELRELLLLKQPRLGEVK